ncbi:MAG: type I methionyl aminopeptidase [Anaerolineaceae bacterium]|nr:type I methionyl aminopeptidase [Anaerolineaceae bacterium]
MSWERNINIKSSDELALMREAGRINAEALEAVKKTIAPGVTTGELNEVAESVLRKYNTYSPFKNYPGPYPYPGSICTSINEELVHGIPGKRKLRSGDIISVDCGTVYQGYVGDSAFTVGVGEINKEAQRLIDVTIEALKIATGLMVAGNYTGDIGAAVQRYVNEQGLFITKVYTGHGVGRQMHEGPQVPNYGKPGSGYLLREGMTIALEPMVLVGTPFTKEKRDGWTVVSKDSSLTAHYENTIAVTTNGPMILTAL